MKKSSPLYLVLALMFFFVYGCDPREETKQPVADFNFTPTSDIAPGDVVTFNNLSTDAETYSWDFNDGSPLSVAQHPTHEFDEAGEFDVTLTVQNKNLKDQISKKVIVISPVTACFTFDPSTAVVGEVLTFTNCSEGADSYEWDIDSDGTIDSRDFEPTGFYFTGSGTFEIKLIAIAGSSTDEVIHSITITENTITIDPTEYWGIPGWVEPTFYYNDFSSSGDWYEGTGVDYEITISDGVYKMIDSNNADDHFGYFITNDNVDLPIGNYDYEARIKNTVDNGNYGSGIIFGGLDFDYNYFKYSIGLYRIGDTGDGDWVEWTVTEDGNAGDWNKLTVRKYLDTYYFFINEVFLYSDDYSNYGDEFGFGFDKNTTVEIDFVGIYIMDLDGKKSSTVKSQINTAKSKTNVSKLKKATKDLSHAR